MQQDSSLLLSLYYLVLGANDRLLNLEHHGIMCLANWKKKRLGKGSCDKTYNDFYLVVLVVVRVVTVSQRHSPGFS